MAQISNKITSIIELFLEELQKNNINIEKTVLFGSHAHGTDTAWSDIDLAIVSSDFEGDRFKDRNKIRRIKLKISSNLEPIPFPPEDFTPDNPFVQQILKTGIMIPCIKNRVSSKN